MFGNSAKPSTDIMVFDGPMISPVEFTRQRSSFDPERTMVLISFSTRFPYLSSVKTFTGLRKSSPAIVID